MLLSGVNDCQRKFISAFKKNKDLMVSTALMTMLYPLWCYLFVVYLDMGVIGSSMSNLVSILIYMLTLVTYSNSQPDMVFASQRESNMPIDYKQVLEMWKLGSF